MNHTAPYRLPLRSSLIRIGFGLVLCAGLLTQCRMAQKSVTGVDMNVAGSTHGRGHGRDRCVRECNEAYREARADERKRHRAALCACRNDRECKADERKLHESIVEKLKEERRSCKHGCYNEGGGHGR